MHWGNCWSNSFKPLDKQFLNKTYLVDDIFDRFFYEDVFSTFLKKKAEIGDHINAKEVNAYTRIEDEALKINENQKLIKDTNIKIKQIGGKINKDETYCSRLDSKLNGNFLEENVKVGMSVKRIKVQENILKLQENIAELYNNINDCKKQISESEHVINNIKCDIELIQIEKELIKLYPFDALKAAQKKLNFVRDSRRLHVPEGIKKIWNKKENCNFSRVWFVKFNKFVLITMFSYFYLKIKIWKKKKTFNFNRKRRKNSSLFAFFNKKSGLNQQRTIFNNCTKKGFFVF